MIFGSASETEQRTWHLGFVHARANPLQEQIAARVADDIDHPDPHVNMGHTDFTDKQSKL
ncbi:hypothetical protein HC62_10795 [Acetobacter tropicalis]|uniref:Uncharacterized protein n=1 Tax=Acetobacter tropicalis TaxID=104102 RepID=A0A252A7A4_9PROT|nr:hypothetical protein HC62_10795 [Acetobacter tropicalis]